LKEYKKTSIEYGESKLGLLVCHLALFKLTPLFFILALN
jgi:hypothetical protein